METLATLASAWSDAPLLLPDKVAEDLVRELSDSGIEFVIAEVMYEEGGKTFNQACTLVIHQEKEDAAPFV